MPSPIGPAPVTTADSMSLPHQPRAPDAMTIRAHDIQQQRRLRRRHIIIDREKDILVDQLVGAETAIDVEAVIGAFMPGIDW